jgi:filamentous hemagglutinin family protein
MVHAGGGVTGSHPTNVNYKNNIYAISGGTKVGANLFDSFSSFSLAAGQTATWSYVSGVRNLINEVTGRSPSVIDGAIDTSKFGHASVYFINPAGVIFGQGASLNVPGAMYVSTAQELKFADSKILTVATPAGSQFSMATPSAFGFLAPTHGARPGNISIARVPSGAFGGSLFLAAANLDVASSAFSTGSLVIAAVGGDSRDVAISAPLSGPAFAGRLNLTNSTVTSFAGPRSSGSLRVAAGDLTLDGATLSTSSFGDVTPGNISIRTGDLTVQSGGALQSSPMQSGDGGNIRINASGTVTVSGEHSVITARVAKYESDALTPGGKRILSPGNAGAVHINATSVIVEGGGHISTAALGKGDGGPLTLIADSIELHSNGLINTNTNTGNAGDLTINDFGSLVIDDGGGIESTSSGDGGDITIHAAALELADGKILATSTKAAGGSITIGSPIIDLTQASTIHTNGNQTQSSGSAGDIVLQSENITVAALSTIVSDSTGAATSGDISIRTGNLTVLSGGKVTASPAQSGNAGNIDIHAAGTVTVSDANSVDSTAPLTLPDGSSLIAARVLGSFSPGDAGTVTIVAESVVATNGARITSAARGFGHAGSLTIKANSVEVSDNGSINTNARLGVGGDITIDIFAGGRLVIQDTDPPEGIATNSGLHTGGEITIADPAVIVLDGGRITALGLTSGASLHIDAGTVVEGTDRPNLVAVNGSLVFNSGIVNVGGAVTVPEITYDDASKVLRGQCPALRARGETSQLGDALHGPFTPAEGTDGIVTAIGSEATSRCVLGIESS